MFIKLWIFCIIYVLSVTSSLSLKQCDSCISLSDCDAAYNLVKNDYSTATFFKIKNSACVMRSRNNAIQEVSVCCSDFFASRMQNDDELENHENRNLLPNVDTCGYRSGNKLIGGSIASLNEFPWMVTFLNSNKSPVCGAALINERYILTAAHCVIGWEPTTVRLGEYDFFRQRDCNPIIKHYCTQHIDFEIAEVITHPKFKRFPSLVNDIALVRLAKPANFSYDNIKPICLPIPQNLRNKELAETEATIAGWGRTERNEISHVLRKADITVLNETMCDSYYTRSSDNNNFCAGTKGKDTCRGDSGGPLMILDEYYSKYNMVQYGIVSYGYIECNGSKPGVYVDVRPYLKWILDSIKA